MSALSCQPARSCNQSTTSQKIHDVIEFIFYYFAINKEKNTVEIILL